MTVDSVLESFYEWVQVDNIWSDILTILAICVGFLIITGILRLLFGKNGTAVGAVSTALDITEFYIVIILLPVILPVIESYLPALPFVTAHNGTITILPIPEIEHSVMHLQLLYLVILSFIFGLTGAIIPEGKKLIVWLLLRLCVGLIVCITMCLIFWLTENFLPGFVPAYASKILLILLAIFLAVTLLKWLFGAIIGVSLGPVIGAIYTFFVSNIVGKQLTKAALSSAMIIGLLTLLWQYESVIHLSSFPALFIILILILPISVRYFISKVF